MVELDEDGPLELEVLRRRAAQLERALESRIVIEQAKGLLMSTGLTAEAAFHMLRKASQRENRKLHQVATDLVANAERRAATAEESS